MQENTNYPYNDQQNSNYQSNNQQNSNYPYNDQQNSNYPYNDQQQPSVYQDTAQPIPPVPPAAPAKKNPWILYTVFGLILGLIVAVSVILGFSLADNPASSVQLPYEGNQALSGNSNDHDTNGTPNEYQTGPVSTVDSTTPTTNVTPTEDILNAEDENAPTEAVPPIPVTGPNAATKKLDPIWQAISEDSPFFVIGGDINSAVVNAAGNHALEDEGLIYSLYVPEDQIANLASASSLMHAMLPNNFTCGMFQVTGDAVAFAEAMKASIGSAQWICGQPDKMIVAVIDGEYVLACFGINDAIVPFETALGTVYADANILYNEAIGG